MTNSLLKLATLAFLTFSVAAQADTTVKAQDTMDIQVLTSVNDAKFADWSNANGVSAKVFQMAYGDGGLNTSTAFVVIQGLNARGFAVASNISGIKRITFSGLGELTINYTRSKPTIETAVIEENHSVKVIFTKQADGTISDSAVIKD